MRNLPVYRPRNEQELERLVSRLPEKFLGVSISASAASDEELRAALDCLLIHDDEASQGISEDAHYIIVLPPGLAETQGRACMEPAPQCVAKQLAIRQGRETGVLSAAEVNAVPSKES